MKKTIGLCTLLCVFIFNVSANPQRPELVSLFATVTNISNGDMLSVREWASHRANKVGELSFDAAVGIDLCRYVYNGQYWCRVSALPQLNSGIQGWVNARYLSFHNRGYVEIAGQRNDCFYATNCRNGYCFVVKDFAYDYVTDSLRGIRSEVLPRYMLQPADQFSALKPGINGYCIRGRIVDDFLRSRPAALSP